MTTDLNDAREAFDVMLDTVINRSGLKKYTLCFTDKENFRKEIYPEYKTNRSSQRKPMGFKPFREEVISKYPSVQKPKLEADDVIGILATKPKSDFVIYSEDKDLKQIPGKHLTEFGIVEITKEEGDHFHMMQTLTGDPVDGYPGCPGIGKVKAERLLSASPDTHWEVVTNAYASVGLTEEDALVQARMARILQWDNWNKDTQEVILWTPPKSKEQ